jgi:hypothetical protein
MVSRSVSEPLKPITTVRGAALWRALGFANARAFQRAYKAGRIALRLYPIPGQSRGLLARRDELVAYLAKGTNAGLVPMVTDQVKAASVGADQKGGPQ